MRDIKYDFKVVEEFLEFLKRNQECNFKVKEPNYLTPTVYALEPPLPMNHRLGLNSYLQRILIVLTKADFFGRVSPDELPPRAPNYLKAYAG